MLRDFSKTSLKKEFLVKIFRHMEYLNLAILHNWRYDVILFGRPWMKFLDEIFKAISYISWRLCSRISIIYFFLFDM